MVESSRSFRSTNPRRTTNPGFQVQGDNPESASNLSDRLRKCMELAGGGVALSQKAGIPRSTLETYLTGRAEPKISRIIAMAEAAGVSLNWLATGEGPMERGGDQVYAAPEPRAGEVHEHPASQFKPFVNLDHDLMADVVVAVEEILAERGLRLPPDRKGELIATLYEMEAEAEEGAEPSADSKRRNVTRLLRLVS